MPATRKQKEETLSELTKNFKEAKSIVFSQYQGTNVKNMRELRKRLRGQKVKFKIAKKTLMTLAAKTVGFDQIPDGFMQGPIGLAFSMEDEIAPAKIIHEFGKVADTVKIVGAVFEGKLMSAEDIKAIAVLPTREVLLAKLVGCMKSPISGFHAVLHSLLRSFVYVMSEVQKKRPA